MKMRVLPKTCIKVTEIGLGCEHLEGQDFESIDKVISAAIDSGINIFDVFMSEPNVRTNIGKSLSGRRDKVIIQGHIGAAWKDSQYARTRDPKECRYFFEDLLARLQTDYIDIGMLHYIDDGNDFDAVFNGPVLQYALELISKGVIKALGMSSHNPSVALRAVKTGLLDVLMFSINPAFDVLPPIDKIDYLFDPNTFRNEELKGMDPVRAELYKTCETYGVAITVMKGLGAGTLLNEKASPLGAALTPVQCIHYSLTRPSVASILVGARKPEELYDSLKYNISTDAQKDYSVVLSGTSKYSVKGKCMYCNHCLPCPAEIDIAAVHKFLDLALISDTVPDTVREHYLALNNKADSCIQCGNCEANCPFEVHVIERMRQAAKIFG